MNFIAVSPDHAGSMSKDAVPSSDLSCATDESRSGTNSTPPVLQQDVTPEKPVQIMASHSLKPSSASEGTSDSQQVARDSSPRHAHMPMIATKEASLPATSLPATLECSSQVPLQHANDILDAALASNEAACLSAGILAAVKALGSADPEDSMLLQVSSPV